MLYPLKFVPQYKYRLWGGDKLSSILKKTDVPEKTGESWELSGVQDSVSVVANGMLQGNSIEELIEIYMGDLIGDSVYEKFGVEFPLLIKFIDANQVLSIQVHPDDELASKRHNAYGKTEMWYIIQSDEGAELFTGFNKDITKDEFLDFIETKTLESVLNKESVQKGDCFFIPAGRVHATGAGILFAEIQQTSDITYRIFDWNRVDKDGEARELHTDLSVDTIDFKHHKDYRTRYQKYNNHSNRMVDCNYFTTNYFPISQITDKEYTDIDSFIIYICLSGGFAVEYDDNKRVSCNSGETILIPANLKMLRIIPTGKTEILEVFIKSDKAE